MPTLACRTGGPAVQTAQARRLVGHRSPMGSVYSLENDPVLNELGVRTTTDPIQLGRFSEPGIADSHNTVIDC
ncbi:hypothetical protein ABB07_00640 [Streptomyces incarnatus]|uniref:Uncharacterized protein n=1 Tax=Streptomyces incarnatus TaxID=665007 RepID=A0ABM5TCB2_9ACTN|nr:hypothetical protein ABB07_00640 [Streptomyces incarnatus]